MKKTLMASVAAFALASPAFAAGHLAFAEGEGEFNWDSYKAWAESAPDLSGQQLTIFGPWLTPEDGYFSNMLAYFNEATGAEAVYTGSDSFEQQIIIDAEAGSAPNIAVFPQPGLASGMAGDGFLSPLPEGTADWTRDNYAAGQSWVDLGTYADADGNDNMYGFFFNVNLKSIVWYSPENFEDAGYEVPESMEDLKALTQQIAADGETPWCIGLGSGAATGWPATDWVEDMMLRTQEPGVYDEWVANTIPFTDERVSPRSMSSAGLPATTTMLPVVPAAVASTDFRDSPKGMFTSPPQCYMHRQASFASAFFPEDVVVGEDADFFYFPASRKKTLARRFWVPVPFWAITNPSDAADALMTFLQTPIAHEIMMAQTGFLTPHKGVNLAAYNNDTLRKQGDDSAGRDHLPL